MSTVLLGHQHNLLFVMYLCWVTNQHVLLFVMYLCSRLALLKDIAAGMSYMHTLGYIHGRSVHAILIA
jgi:hypothetical protein